MSKCLAPEIIALLRKRELEKFRAFHSERSEYRASINGKPNGYASISESELKSDAFGGGKYYRPSRKSLYA